MNKKYLRKLIILVSTFFLGLLSSCLKPTVITKEIPLYGIGGSGTTQETGFYMLVCNGNIDYFFDNYFYDIPYVPEGSGYNTFNIEWKWESTEGTEAVAQMVSDDDTKMASSCIYHTLKGKWMTLSCDCLAGARYNDWSYGNGAETNCADSVRKLRFYIQNSNNNWNTTYGTVYIRKVWLSAPGKEDCVLFNANIDYSQLQELSIETSVSTTEPTNNDVVITIYTSKTNISRIGYVYSENFIDFNGGYSILYNGSFIGAEKYSDGIYKIRVSANGYYWIAALDTYGYWFYVLKYISNINKTTAGMGPRDAIRNWVPETTSSQWAVYNYEDLEKLAEIVNGGDDLAGVTITQKENIIINESVLGDGFIEPEEAAEGEPNASLRNFAGIGSKNYPFAGTYNGNEKIISGLYIYGAQQGLGFFGGLSGATIKNVIILDGCVVNKNTWESVDLNNSLTHDGSDDDRFGGLVGMIVKNGGENTVENCLFVGTVGSQAAKDRGYDYEYIGGIIGRVEQGSTANLKNCYSLVRLYGSAAALVKKVSGTLNCTDCIGVSLDGKVYKTQVAEELTLDAVGGVSKSEIITAAKTACGIDLTEYFVKAGL